MLLSAVSTLAILSGTYAVIGPSAHMHIVNKNIQPDGFSRSLVSSRSSNTTIGLFLAVSRAVLAGETADKASFPGPLIAGVKVRRSLPEAVENTIPALGRPFPPQRHQFSDR
jgi:iron transport multicopper oxidase